MLFLEFSDTRLGNIASLFGIIVVCILVIAASYFFTRFVGGKQLSQQKNSNFKTMDTFQLGQNKYLMLIQVGKRYFVIAVCKETVTMLSEIAKEDITVLRESGQGAASFKSIFAGFMKNKPDSGKKETSRLDEGERDEAASNFPSSGSEYDDDIK